MSTSSDGMNCECRPSIAKPLAAQWVEFCVYHRSYSRSHLLISLARTTIGRSMTTCGTPCFSNIFRIFLHDTVFMKRTILELTERQPSHGKGVYHGNTTGSEKVAKTCVTKPPVYLNRRTVHRILANKGKQGRKRQ